MTKHDGLVANWPPDGDAAADAAPIPIGSPGDRLACPHCGSEYLHHREVVVLTTEREDSPTLTETVVDVDGAITVSSVKRLSLHGRRYLTLIRFDCENCPRRSTLRIMQHKGVTLIEWLELRSWS